MAQCVVMPLVQHTDDEIARQRVRTILRARWVGAAFGLFQVLAYRTFPYPPDLREIALGVVALFVVSNVVFEVVRRRDLDAAAVRRLALIVLVTDVLLASGITWVYAFDAVSALFAVLFLLPIEGAVLFGLPGAAWTWGAVTVLYVGREWLGVRYDNPFEFESVTFRMGLVGIVALIVGFLVRDLEGQRRVTSAALDDARQANESRSRLISMLAHDVRAPIAGARSAIDTIRSAGDRVTPDQRDRLLAAGQRQADRALFIAADLLDLARVESGTLSVDPKVVPLAPLLARVGEVLGDRLQPEVAVGDVEVWADGTRLEQVVYNLLDNAAKYGEPPVRVSAVRDGDEVELVICDRGPGVPDDVELFTAFSHAGEGSVGLGVWIVGQLVDAMGGTIAYRDNDPGACFVLRLPAVPPGQPVRPPSSSANGTTAPVPRS